MPLKLLPFCQRRVRPTRSQPVYIGALLSLLIITVFLERSAGLTIAFSCELLACVMPRMFVVCITSTEKLGSQLAIRDPRANENPAQV